jgi:RimJ/RimL family protein N-acetyltransferase
VRNAGQSAGIALPERCGSVAATDTDTLRPAVTVLATQRLTLRKMCIDDAAFMLDLLNQPSWLRFIGDRGVTTEAAARKYIANGAMQSYQRFGFGFYVVELTTEGVPIGICGLTKRDYLPDVDLGYALLPQYWSRGLAGEAAAGVIEFSRSVLQLPRLAAITSLDNDASIRVLEKLGMRFEQIILHPETHEQLKLFGIDLARPAPL